jgi:hypothetical protein
VSWRRKAAGTWRRQSPKSKILGPKLNGVNVRGVVLWALAPAPFVRVSWRDREPRAL